MNVKRRAVIVGFDYYARYLAQLMNELSDHWELQAFDSSRIGTARALWTIRHADALISFGGPAPNVALAEAARLRDIPVFVIWAGSDVRKAASDPSRLEVIKSQGFINLSDGAWLVDELLELGIKAVYRPVTAIHAGGPPKPFSSTFRVLTYLPEPRRDFYGQQRVYQIARALPEVTFQVIGAGARNPEAPPNVDFCGYVGDMVDRIDASTVLLRLPDHDGKSMLVLEVLARGRHVVWNYDFPGVHAAHSVDDALAIVRGLRDAHARGALSTNESGRDFVLREFSRPVIADAFEAALDTGLRERLARSSNASKRVAISGLNLFCAEIAEQTKNKTPDWSPCILTANSRLEVLTSLVNLARADVWYSIGSPMFDRWLHWFAYLMRKPRVFHWVGSDIGVVRREPRLRKFMQRAAVKHLTEVEWTAAELRALGIESEIVPLPPRQPAYGEVAPLPETFTVMLYLPKTRGTFYGRAHYERLMRRLRQENVRFLIVGGGDIKIPDGVDARSLGWRHSLRDVYPEATVLVRGTRHDGLSLMVLEALSFGRHVLWSQDFPYTRHVVSYDDMESTLFDLLAQHREGRLRPQYDAASVVRERYGIDRCIRAISDVWNAAIAQDVPKETVAEASWSNPSA
ncbi:MAG: hypothetical protein ACXWNK_01615 [Vulcanimicrobiaceae bacterium]